VKKNPGKTFPVPSGIVFAHVDTRTGLLASQHSAKTRMECFLEGTEPREYAEDPWEEEPFDFFSEDLGPSEPIEALPESKDRGD